ncbi:MAG: VCBS repeat-containing protein [Planctomycetaceae bacterium]|nr:VCBS repeat-containing protein [Planctomycetaceae bacterium]
MKLQSTIPWSACALAATVLVSVARAQISFDVADPVFCGNFPQDVVAADLDGDGVLELAVTLRSPPRIAVLHRNYPPKYSDPTFTPLVGARYPIGLVAPDIDGDGLPDLAVVSRDTDELFVLHNLGAAHYVLFERIAVGDGPSELDINDLDGDGDLDFVVSNGLGNSVTVVLNDGAGTFSVLPAVGIGASPKSLAVGCFGYARGALRLADVAVADHDSHAISVLRNDGTGVLVPAETLSIPGFSHPEGLVAADFNGDERDDLAACFSGAGLHKVAVFHNLGGSFAAPLVFNVGGAHPTHLAAADFDRDGRLDLAMVCAASQCVTVLRQNEDGVFDYAGAWDLPGTGSDHLAVADLDGSAYPDIVATIDAGDLLQPLYNLFANPRSYGYGAPNSVGFGAELAWRGSPSVGAGDFALTVAGAPGQRAGIFLRGMTGDLRPFQSGYLCIAPPIVRMGAPVILRDDGCTEFVFDFAGEPYGTGVNALEPGSAWNFQFWYRDTLKGLATSNLTNGVRAIFLP